MKSIQLHIIIALHISIAIITIVSLHNIFDMGYELLIPIYMLALFIL